MVGSAKPQAASSSNAMPPLSMLGEVLLYSVAPAALTAAALLVVIERLGGPRLASAVGLLAGAGLGLWLGDALTLIPGMSPWNRLPAAALAATAVGVTVQAARIPAALGDPAAAVAAVLFGWIPREARVPAALGWMLRAACSAWLAWWIVPETLRWESWWLVPAFAIVVFSEWAVMEDGAARSPGATAPLVLGISAYVAAAVLIHAGSARLTDAAIVLGSALSGIALIAWWRRCDAGGAVPGAAVFLPGLLLVGQQETFSDIPWPGFAIAAAAPLALVFSLPARTWPMARLHLLRLALMLPPWIAALYLARQAGPLEFE
jgi:hypothetical protein